MTAQSIHTDRSLDEKGSSMPRLARSLGWLAAAGLWACFAGPLAADDAPYYPPAASSGAFPNRRIDAAAAAQPQGLTGTPVQAPTAPRLLPAAYQSPQTPPPQNGDGSNAPTEPAHGPRPIPLSRASGDAPSALSGFPGGGMPSLVNAATSLGIVLLLFMLVAWAVRRGMPKGSATLPREAVEVLGRAQLVGRQQVHLVRCGNKIVLLNVSPNGVETLTEITDPAEVDRLHSVCQPPSPGGSLRHWLGHFTGSARSSEYLTREEAEALDFRHLDTPGQHRL
jgi:flagellar biogenesis protein FliO